MRVRLRFTKYGKIRFLGHRDLARLWERTLRRARVPVTYSEGFSPRMKLSFGLALPVGCESDAEYLDLPLDPTRDDLPTPEVLAARLSELLPGGVDVVGATETDPRGDSLQQLVTHCGWRVEIDGPDGEPPPSRQEVEAAVDRVLGAATLPVTRERKGKAVSDDLRPAILGLAVDATPGDGGRPVLVADLTAQPRSVRPGEVLAVLDPTWREGRVRRTHQWFERDGRTQEPVAPFEGTPVDLPTATGAPRTKVCAS